VSTNPVQIPGKAVSADDDVRQPVRDLLEDLHLLGNRADTAKASSFTAVFTGPPDSVALIEAGATALGKWWAAGLSATVVAVWARVFTWWGGQPEGTRQAALIGAAVVTAAIALAIGYLLASDVRGRAAASVATIEARALVATTMIEAAQHAYRPDASISTAQVVPLPAGIRANNLAQPAGNEADWLAVAMERHVDGTLKYVLVKGTASAVVSAPHLEFV
jgi:hypothetical protein